MRHAAFTLLNSQLVGVALALSIDKQCGKTICAVHEYCSIFNEQCEKCSDICDKNTHNYDEKHCSAYCKDYVSTGDLEGEIKELKRNQWITLILLVILLVIVLLNCGFRITRWIRKNGSISSCILSKIKNNKTTTNLDPVVAAKQTRSDGSQIFSMSGVDGSVVQTVSTPISTRYPAENSTTEYSYDNAALQISPGGDKPSGPETKF